MSSFSNTALELFSLNYNCAQSVLLPFSEILNTDRAMLEKIACGFGGGMGRLQKTCGAVTGAFMVISLYTANTTPDHDTCTELVRTRIKAFHRQFIALHGHSDCRDLLGHDVNTETGAKYIREHNLYDRVCVPCVESAVKILQEMIT